MNTQNNEYDASELEFEERCEFCDVLLEFVDVRIVRLSVDDHWSLCMVCYETFTDSVHLQ